MCILKIKIVKKKRPLPVFGKNGKTMTGKSHTKPFSKITYAVYNLKEGKSIDITQNINGGLLKNNLTASISRIKKYPKCGNRHYSIARILDKKGIVTGYTVWRIK